jgi:hypothetical protein
MENRSFDNLKSDLVSLGFSYVGEPSKIAPDTENVIIEIIKLFTEDQKLYRILLAWMDRFGDLIHVERLASQVDLLSDYDKLILGVTALKRVNAGDIRFKVIYEKILKQKNKINFNLSGQDNYLIEKHGIDLEFKAFGITTSKILPSENKKIMDRKWVLKINPWLRLRALLGSNFRADMTFIRLSHQAVNAYAAMKLLRCSKETSYRIWGSLEEAGVESLIQI